MKETDIIQGSDEDSLNESESLSKETALLKEDYLKFLEERASSEHVLAYKKVLEICQKISEAGGKALLVGGSVRDIFMGRIPKDFDLEIYKLEHEKLSEILSTIPDGEVSNVGKAFGILKIVFKEKNNTTEESASHKGLDIDVSIPRKDSKIGEGHKGFEINTDPFMSIKEAARRRDFTMNTLAADPLTNRVYDPFDGIKDIKERVLRITDAERFKDDALRVLRALQFIGRYGLSLETKSHQIIEQTVPDLKHISKERFGEEWDKLLLKSEEPSYGLIAGMALGIFKEAYPEFIELINTPQEYEWHPEGDVWTHTLMVVDCAAEIARRENLDENESKVLIYAALCHDLGKATTTEFKDGRIKSHAHDRAGIEPTKKLLERVNLKSELSKQVEILVADHLTPGMLYIDFVLKNDNGEKNPSGAIRRLAKRIHPATIRLLSLVGEADHMGRGPFIKKFPSDESASEQDVNNFILAKYRGETTANISELFQFIMPQDYPAGRWLTNLARELKVEESKPADLITGKQLESLGYKGGQKNRDVGRIIGEMIRVANDLRDEAAINSKGEKYDTSDKILLELTEWYDLPYPHLDVIKDPAQARDKLKKILEEHRKNSSN